MQSQVNLCLAAGIDITRLSLLDMYITAKAIIDDDELLERAKSHMSYVPFNEDTQNHLEVLRSIEPNRFQALMKMSEADKAALRQRVTL